MLASERLERIMAMAAQGGRVTTAEIVSRLGVSPITARRDLTALCDARRLLRVHGGAILPTTRGRLSAEPDLVVGLVVPTRGYYYSQVVRGAEDVAAALGCRLALSVSQYDSHAERDHVSRLVDFGATGILLTPSRGPEAADGTAEWLDSIPVPVVIMERAFGHPETTREYDYVRTDHAYGAGLALRHLAELGHRSVGLALGRETPTSRWLAMGYDESVRRLGLDPNAPVVETGDIDAEPQAVNASLAAFLDACLASGVRAAFVHTDAHAARLLELAMSRGLDVPRDFAIVAYDDEMAAFSAVPLTAVGPPKRDIGILGLRVLRERIDNPLGLGFPIRHIDLLPTLTVRQSSRPSDDDR